MNSPLFHLQSCQTGIDVTRRRGCRVAGAVGFLCSADDFCTTVASAAAEEEVPQEVPDGVAFGPFEVGVRADTGNIPQGEQDRGDRVGCGGASGAQHPVPVDLDTANSLKTSRSREGSMTSISRTTMLPYRGHGFISRCGLLWPAYSARSPSLLRFASRVSAPSKLLYGVGDELGGRPVELDRSTRSSVVRATRETSESTMMPAMNSAEMAIPLGCSTTFATNAYSSTRVSTVTDRGAAVVPADGGEGDRGGAGDHHG